MRKWEYKLVRFFQDKSESDEEIQNRLNRLGEEGWEIFAAMPDNVSGYVTWLAKREKWGYDETDEEFQIPF
jgi:hypothetical protein